MNVVSIWRNRSGLAWASCSCRKRAGSILLGAVIASFLLGLWKVIQKITRWPPLRPGLTRVGAVVHHLGGRHWVCVWPATVSAPGPCSVWPGALCRRREVRRWWWALAGSAGAAGD